MLPPNPLPSTRVARQRRLGDFVVWGWERKAAAPRNTGFARGAEVNPLLPGKLGFGSPGGGLPLQNELLELELRGNHDAPRNSALADNRPERTRNQRTVGVAGIHVVQDVLRFEPQLQPPRFREHRERLHQGKIPLREAGTAHLRKVARDVADLIPLHDAERTGAEIGGVPRCTVQCLVPAHPAVVLQPEA